MRAVLSYIARKRNVFSKNVETSLRAVLSYIARKPSLLSVALEKSLRAVLSYIARKRRRIHDNRQHLFESSVVLYSSKTK